jgi:hypothetical protein
MKLNESAARQGTVSNPTPLGCACASVGVPTPINRLYPYKLERLWIRDPESHSYSRRLPAVG